MLYVKEIFQMNNKHIKNMNCFDPEYFVIHEVYQVFGRDRVSLGNMILRIYEPTCLTFTNVYGSESNFSVSDYENGDIDFVHLVPEEEVSVDEVNESDENDSDEDTDNHPAPKITARVVDYRDMGSYKPIMADDPSELEVYKTLNSYNVRGTRNIQIKPFYYKIIILEHGEKAIHKARYEISDEPVDGFKLHPLFKSKYDVVTINDDFIKGADQEIMTNKSYDEFKEYINESCIPKKISSMVSIELLSALQLLALVELGPVEMNDHKTIGREYHMIHNLFDRNAMYIDGLTYENGYIMLHGHPLFTQMETDTLCGYIKYFKYCQNEDYDWLFIPETVCENQENTTRSFCYICPKYDIDHKINNDNHVLPFALGGTWYDQKHTGMFFYSVNYDTTYSYCSVGARLMYHYYKGRK